MFSYNTSLSQCSDLFAFVSTLFLLPFSDCCTKKVGLLYERDDAHRYLRIERLPGPSGMAFTNPDIETSRGKMRVRELRDTLGSIFRETPNGWRIVVDSRDASSYRVLCDDFKLAVVGELADALDLQVVPERRKRHAYRLVCNDEVPIGIEQSRGQPKWPALRPARRADQNAQNWFLRARATFSHGGIYVGSNHDFDYCDDITFDDLAQFLEQELRYPVVNETNLNGRYHFKIQRPMWRHASFTDPYPLPGLGVSLVAGSADVDVLVVSDSTPSCGATSFPGLSSLLFNSFESATAIQQKK